MFQLGLRLQADTPGVAGPRVAPALACSAGVHVLILAATLLIVSRVAGPLSDGGREPLLPQAMVWLNEPGPGGGGGGGGNRMEQPPRRLEVRGQDQVSMPAVKAPAISVPADIPQDAPPMDQHVVVPIQFVGAALDTRPGTLDGVAGGLSLGTGSGGGAGSGVGSGVGDGIGAGIGDGVGGGTGGGILRPGAGIENPVPIKEVKPVYTTEAMRLRIQGTVWIECVVYTDGSVGRPRVIRSLDPTFGLDEEALKAARQWRFRPARRNGQPVPLLISIAIDFNLM